MNRLNQFAASIYPRWWRERYGAEFTALLDDARPGLAGTLDICKGAIRMQATTWSLKRLVAIFALLGIAVATGVGFAMQKQYQSVAVIRIAPSESGEAEPNSETTRIVSQLQNEAFSRRALVNLIRQKDLYKDELARHPQEEVIEGMRRAIQLVPMTSDGSHPAAFLLRFTYPDAKLSAATTETIARALTDSMPRLQLVELSQGHGPVSPNRVAIGLAGLAGGLVTGTLLALIVLFSRTFKIVRKTPPPADA